MSPLGFDYDQNVINLNDSAEISAYIVDERDVPIPEDDLVSVKFTVQKPDAVFVEHTGTIEGDGKGFLLFNDTDLVGEYKTVATFTLSSTSIRSVRSDFEVIDPFNPPQPSDEDIIAGLVWNRLQDLFDSEEGGPWLQDQTKATFKRNRIKDFIAEGLFDINNQSPPTAVALGEFVINGAPDTDAPLVTQGVLIAVIRHLIRSYVEQPAPTGAQITYEDRRDYLQRWQSILQMEEQRYMRFVALWKRQYLGLGSSRTLVSSKAGRLIPAPMRSRNVGRGYY